jgi:hypothetical protein
MEENQDMAADRVDKRWQEQGLGKYETGAILGTLTHYGVPLDEAGFRALAKEKYPLEMALFWQETWKGTGQFKLFPSAAATELWKRLEGDRMAPVELAQGLMDLMVALAHKLDGSQDAKVAEKFAAFEALKARAPKEGEGAEERFTGEVFAHFSEDAWKVFDGMAQRLAQAGHAEDARGFAQVEAFLVPEREGVALALVEATEGKRDEALAKLGQIAGDGKGSLERRMSALEGLLTLEAKDQVIELGLPMLDEAEKAEDFHLGLGLADQLATLLREKRDFARAQEVEAKLEKLAEAHDRAHPHHHHH